MSRVALPASVATMSVCSLASVVGFASDIVVAVASMAAALLGVWATLVEVRRARASSGRPASEVNP